MTRIVYFAWVREKIGTAEEDIDIPASVRTAGELIAYLTTLGENYEAAFEFPDVIRVAVNQEHVEHDEVGSALAAEELQRRGAVAHERHMVAFAAQDNAQAFALDGVVFDNQDVCSFHFARRGCTLMRPCLDEQRRLYTLWQSGRRWQPHF